MPPEWRSTSPPSTSPSGRKKLVPACRSSSSMMAAAVSGGNARMANTADTRYVHAVSGNRIIDMPGARQFKMVTT